MATDHILLIHTDPAILRSLEERVQNDGYRVSTASDTAEAASILSNEALDIIICENGALRGRGADFVEWVQDRLPSAVVVVLSSWADFDMALEGLERAMKVREKLAPPRFAFDDEPEAAPSPRIVWEGDSEAAAGPTAQELERQYPGITRLKKDANGFLILGDR